MSHASEAESTDKRMVGAQVDEDLHREIRHAAAEADVSIAQYIRNLLRDDVE